jgi:hypothetical protein
MGSEYLADSRIQGYLVHNIRLEALDWFNIETSLLEDELKNYHTCYVSSTVNKVYHHLVNHSYSRNRVTIQQIVITFPQTVITLSEDIRLVRELVNRGQNVANALYIIQRFRKSLQRFEESL